MIGVIKPFTFVFIIKKIKCFLCSYCRRTSYDL